MNWKMTEAVRLAALEQLECNTVPFRMVCPVCKGGSGGEESLSIWESDLGIWATCHRAACAWHSTTSLDTVGYVDRARTPKEIPDTRLKELLHNYGKMEDIRSINQSYEYQLSPDTIVHHMRSHPTDSLRYVMPMRDHEGAVRGCIVKAFKCLPVPGPKSLTFKEKDYNGMSWYRTQGSMLTSSVWLVEDPISALVLKEQGLDAVSLNGTVLNDGRIDILRRFKWDIHLCLDADATRQSLRLARRYLSTCRIRVHRLVKDFKDMTNEEVKEWLLQHEEE